MPKLNRSEWADIQALIVYGYNHLRYGHYFFLHITDAAAARRWLAGIIPQVMTVQAWEDDDPHRNHKTAVNLAFSHAGLAALGLPERTLQTFSREFIEGMAPAPKRGDQKAVRAQILEKVAAQSAEPEPEREELSPRSIILGDHGESAPWHWDRLGGPQDIGTENEIHLLLYINGRSAEDIAALLAEPIMQTLTTGGAGLRIVNEQRGETPHTGREPFGFQDGISNPWIEGTRYSWRKGAQKGPELALTDDKIVKEFPDNPSRTRTVTLTHDPVIKAGEFVLGYENEGYDAENNGQYPQTPLVWEEDTPRARTQLRPFENGDVPAALRGLRDFGRNGSYLVYRKLEQDVVGFWRYLTEYIERRHGVADMTAVQRIAAKFVGRWPSGVPLAKAPEADDPALAQRAYDERNNSLLNDFGYIPDDTSGLACPVGAHVRRANPRDSLFDDLGEKELRDRYKNARRHRIMRRATSFGVLPAHQTDPDFFNQYGAPDYRTIATPEPVGIHFFGINTNIAQQFEFIQQAWCNNARFNGLDNNKDPLVGDNVGDGEVNPAKFAEDYVDDLAREQPTHMVIPRLPVRERVYNLPRFVHVRGGAYLFIPSITALKFLAGE